MTDLFWYYGWFSRVSIHTPTWGVTQQSQWYKYRFPVSIHTPTWGVTPVIYPKKQDHSCFNPHTYMRCDFQMFCKEPSRGFQSTHLHEVWLFRMLICLMLLCFNPHTYMRCDLQKTIQRLISMVSIHTPTWGVTESTADALIQAQFQSTHLHEVWHHRHK